MKIFLQHYLWPMATGLLLAALLLVTDPFQWNLLPVQQPSPSKTEIVSFADAVGKAAPSVVNIYTQKTIEVRRNPIINDPFLQRFLNRRARTERRVENSLGSGVIISPEGYILTAMHVISGANQILILLPDGRESSAEIIGSDAETDLAVLQVTLDNLPVILIGDSSQLRIGDVVLAIGNPYGIGQSVSQGIVSGLDRTVRGLNNEEQYIQTDAGFNFGSSGGALINHKGLLLGINTRAVNSGIGFAIPSNVAVNVVNKIVHRGWLGFSGQFISINFAENASKADIGLLVERIYDAGPAQQQGLEEGDIILVVNDKKITDVNQVQSLLNKTKAGTVLDLQLSRNGKLVEVQLITAEKPN